MDSVRPRRRGKVSGWLQQADLEPGLWDSKVSVQMEPFETELLKRRQRQRSWMIPTNSTVRQVIRAHAMWNIMRYLK